MSKIDGIPHNEDVHPLSDNELNSVSGGVTGERGCIPPFGSADPQFPGWVTLPNPWLTPGSFERRISLG
jgi:bacteriocin-like protein